MQASKPPGWFCFSTRPRRSLVREGALTASVVLFLPAIPEFAGAVVVGKREVVISTETD